MARFMFIYRDDAGCHMEDMSPEQMQEVMECWNGWIGQGMQEGWMVEPGDALKPEGKVINSNKVITDGPFTESKEIVGGFSIIEAEDFDAACKIAESCPALSTDSGGIEVRELAGFGSEVKS